MNSLKTGLVTGVTAIALTGAAAGLTSIAAGSTVASPAVQPVVFGTPLPQQPAADVPTADQVHAVLNGLGNPNVPFRNKANLVEGGIGIVEGRTADRLVQNAQQKGYFPLSFEVSAITPAGPGTATAVVTASGPNLTPTTQTVTFVNDGGWKLSRASGLALLQSALS
ncbi:hypothetical protein ABQE92_07535 [Mycolicibacterium thermoresistibile]